MFHATVTGAEDLRAVSRQLRTVTDGKAMRRDLTKGLRQGVRPAVASVKAAAVTLPAKGPRSTGLRRRMGSATSPQVRTGGRNPVVAVRISRARMGDKAGAARGMDRREFKHPVYGNRDVWVSQRGHPGWFEHAVHARERQVRTSMRAVLDQIEHDLARR